MYNQDVIDRLNNLTNLYALKNANAKVISKKNEFGDVVKFFAQINTENVIQRITYKASGCTTFMALCSYFCEIVEGKTIEKALKINESDLEKFSKLEDSKKHVYKIILDTFALLIKKYRVGVQKGKIVPCEPMKDIPQTKKVKKSSKKTVDIKKIVDINENYLLDTSKKKVKKDKVSNKEKSSKKTIISDIKVSEPVEVTTIVEEQIPAKVTRKKTTKIVKEIPNNQITTTTVEIVNIDNSHSVQDVENMTKATETKRKSLENSRILEQSTRIANIQNEKEKQKIEANDMKFSHINALNDKIKNKETNEKMKSNTENLNSLLNKFKMTNANKTVESQTTVTEVEIKEEVVEDVKTSQKESKEKKNKSKKDKEKGTKKKSLFSWFKK